MAMKTFKDSMNPPMSSMSEGYIPATVSPAKAPKGYKLNPLYIETKSKHLQLQPSLHEKLKSKANAEGISVNQLVNSILQDALVKE